MLQFAERAVDQIVFTNRGRHMDDLEKAVLRGTLQRQTYKEIAKELECSDSHLREIGSELWKILSEELENDISKSNVRSVLEELQVSIFSRQVAQDSVQQIGCINYAGVEKDNPGVPPKSNSQRHDLSEMPELATFYDRASELDTLKTWILEDQCRIISLMGISGIGKTQLALQLVEQIQSEFESVIWRSLEHAPPFAELEADFIQVFCSPQAENASA